MSTGKKLMLRRSWRRLTKDIYVFRDRVRGLAVFCNKRMATLANANCFGRFKTTEISGSSRTRNLGFLP
jgi:hypothetical protein